jgi:hypothetical protein
VSILFGNLKALSHHKFLRHLKFRSETEVPSGRTNSLCSKPTSCHVLARTELPATPETQQTFKVARTRFTMSTAQPVAG